MLTSDISIENVLSMVFYNEDNLHADGNKIDIYKLRGLEVLSWVNFTTKASSLEDYTVYFREMLRVSIDYSVIEFFVGDRPQSACPCTRDIVPTKNGSVSSSMFNYLNRLTFEHFMKYDSRSVCPLIFKNASLLEFHAFAQVDSFIARNLLRFQTTTSESELSSTTSSISL